MIFGELKLESVVQENDKTRLDATSSFITPDEADISLLEIEPEAGAGYFTVTEDKYLDYAYSAAGSKVVSVRITTVGSPQTFSRTLTVVDSATDALFSTDEDIIPLEDDILKYVRKGRNSFLDKHREAQKMILDDLDSARIWKENADGEQVLRYEAADIVDIQEFKEKSKYLCLHLIFKSLSNAVDDIFSQKAARYLKFAFEAGNRAALRLDKDGDSVVDTPIDTASITMVRR